MAEPLELFRIFLELDRRRGRGLEPHEFRRWLELKRQLAREFQPSVSDEQADRRGSIRVPARMQVQLGDVGELRRCWMTNLGRGGLFVATEHLIPIGTRLTLRIELSASGEILELPAAVACHNLDPQFQNRSGMGMRFLDLTPEMEKRLDDLYEGALRRATQADGDDPA